MPWTDRKCVQLRVYPQKPSLLYLPPKQTPASRPHALTIKMPIFVPHVHTHAHTYVHTHIHNHAHDMSIYMCIHMSGHTDKQMHGIDANLLTPPELMATLITTLLGMTVGDRVIKVLTRQVICTSDSPSHMHS